jgi:hypothetical protein
MENSFGIDKIGLYLSPGMYEIDADCPATIQGSKRMTDESEMPLLFIRTDGKAIHGNKAIINTEKFNFTASEHGALLQFNPSKPYHPYELCGRSDELVSRVESVTSELSSLGVRGHWENAKLTRLDFARNVQLTAPLVNYTSGLNLVSFARSRRQAEYPGGYLTGNNTRALIVYDKSAESNLQEYGITRGELQLRNVSATKSIAGTYRDSNLISRGAEIFRNTISKTFRLNPVELTQGVIPFDSLFVLHSKLYAAHGRNTMAYLKRILGEQRILEEYGIERWLAFCAQSGMERKHISREKKQMLDAAYLLDETGMLSNKTRGGEDVKLLTELATKLCA